MENNKIKLFEDRRIRSAWNEKEEEWYFSVVDVVAALTDSPNPRKYWSVLKTRLKNEGDELATNCSQLKIPSHTDGKRYNTDVANTKQLLRLIQSIPSKRAEPFKMWLAQVGAERLDETADPELAINRALLTYRKKGYSDEWINQRLKSIEIRKALTDEWDKGGIKQGVEYAILTDEITKAWSGMTTREYKQLKELKKENLRDNMSNMELVLNMLAEAATTEISKQENPYGFEAHKETAKRGGNVAQKARLELEEQTGKSVIESADTKMLK